MGKPKVTKETVEQEIDLGDAFGVDLSDADALKQAIAQALIDRMQARTESGKGLKFSAGGKAREVELHKPYSKEYVNSLPFKAAGKKKNDINMTLTGDMLASVDVLSTSGNKIKIGIDDELQVLKAFNHITGDTVPERPFFGVSQEDLDAVGEDFASDFQALRVEQAVTPMEQRALDLMDQIKNSDGGFSSIDDTSED